MNKFKNKIICGDSLEIMKLINGECLEEMDFKKISKEELYNNLLVSVEIIKQKQETIDEYEELNR